MGLAWPSTLPRPLLEGYSTSPGNEIVRTDMESGEARTRRRSVSAPDNIKLSWLLDATQMSQFRAYWDAELAGGAAWCDMSIDVGNGIEQKAVRVIGQYTALKVSAAYWKVSCEAEARKLRSTIFDYLNLMGLPSLDLNFAATQSLDPVITSSRQPAPVVSFSRASIATYIGADGLLKTAEQNEPRFDYDPISHVCKGLLIEESRTNLLGRSNEFENVAWVKTRALVYQDVAIAPDGTMSADKLCDDLTAANTHYINHANFTPLGDTYYCYSIFAKSAGQSRKIRLGTLGASNWVTASAAIFDLDTGSIGPINGSPGATMVPVGGGWYRCSVVFLSVASPPGAANAYFQLVDQANQSTYTGDGTSGLYLWGAQLEVGSFPTSYIPTTSVAVSRSADLASMTGANFSSWFNPSSGSFLSEWWLGYDKTAGNVYSVNNGSSGTAIRCRYLSSGTGNDNAVLIADVASAVFSLSAQQIENTKYRNAMAYAVNDFARSAGGATVVVDDAGPLPVVTRLGIGGNGFSASEIINGHISRLTYYPKRLPNATLQALSA